MTPPLRRLAEPWLVSWPDPIIVKPLEDEMFKLVYDNLTVGKIVRKGEIEKRKEELK